MSRPLRVASWPTAALALATVLGLIAAAGLWSARAPGLGMWSQLVFLVLGASFAGAGWFICSESPRDSVGIALTISGLGLLGASAGVWVLSPADVDRIALAVGVLFFAVAVLLFPDGRMTGLVGALALSSTVALCAVMAVRPRDDELVGTAWFFLATIVVCAEWWRFEQADDGERRSLLWLILAGGLTVLFGGALLFAAPNPLGVCVGLVLTMSIPVAFVIGRVAPDLADVRALIARAVLYALLSMLMIAAFCGVASIIEALAGGSVPMGVLGVVAVGVGLTAHPAQALLRGIVTPLLFGDRPDPISAASHVGDRLSDDPLIALRALREVLAIPYAALSDETGSIAVSGQASTALREVPLHVGSSIVGTLLLGLRPGEVRLTAGDDSVLRIVAPALAQVLRSRALAAQLHESRSQLIAAVEDERRRLRRDLHDELGPTLTGVAYAADAARNLVVSDPAGAESLLVGLRADTARAIADIRRLVHGLRPPALDELGLAAAVRQRAGSMLAASGAAMEVEVDVPSPLPALPAAVEVAAYRIVIEALTNVARHAGCDRAWVRMVASDGVLALSVRDAGVSPAAWVPGVGLRSMRERAEALGGTVDVSADTSGGRVSAVLPL
jgi:two-component system NarL family sensor kinase